MKNVHISTAFTGTYTETESDAYLEGLPAEVEALFDKDEYAPFYGIMGQLDYNQRVRVTITLDSLDDIETPFITEGDDRLAKIFAMQDALDTRIMGGHQNHSEEEQQQWLLNYCRAMTHEVVELEDSLCWKWWAKYQKLDTQNAKVEVLDVLFFLIATALEMGMTPEDLFNGYCQKHEVNMQRQNSGYTTKEDDCRHILADDGN